MRQGRRSVDCGKKRFQPCAALPSSHTIIRSFKLNECPKRPIFFHFLKKLPEKSVSSRVFGCFHPKIPPPVVASCKSVRL